MKLTAIFILVDLVQKKFHLKKTQTTKYEKSHTELQLQSFLWLTYINIEKDVTRLFKSSDIKKVWA